MGIFISDENKEIVRDVEKSIKVLRGIEGTLKLGQIIEKGFFIDSSKSVVLQLCDLCALTLRKKEEAKAGFRDNPIYHGGIELLEPLIHRGDEALQDVLGGSPPKKKRSGQGQCPESVRTGSFWSLGTSIAEPTPQSIPIFLLSVSDRQEKPYGTGSAEAI